MIEKNNDNYAIKKLEENKLLQEKLIIEKEYFDNMFNKIDSNIIIDEDQRKIVLADDKYIMVIAGAGSGKTTTISAKVNYLIERKNIKDEEIMIISFTNKAIEELKERINKDFKHHVKINTFHKFGYDVIKKSNPNIKIIKDQYQVIKEYIEMKLINDKKKLKKFLEFYIYYFDISEDILIYKDYNEYYKCKNKQKYPTLKHKIEYIKEKEEVNTKKEKIIANYLYFNNVQYEYQKPYKYNDNYRPDFTIYYKDKVFYIEHYNIDKIKKFEYNIKKIRKLHKKYGTNLIEIYNDDIIEELKTQLKRNNIYTYPKKTEKIFDDIINQNKDLGYKKFINLIITYINLYKSNGCPVIDKEKCDKRERIFYDLINDLYTYYENYLESNNLIDFEDMIMKATKYVKSQKLKYKYIIIDEYQDISKSRFELIKKVSEKTNTKIMVVGDDWQCIYSFASSNINLFINFEKNFPNVKRLDITKTYRNSQELIDVAGEFILKNKLQITKKLTSNKLLKNPITIITYGNEKFKSKLKESIEYIIQKYGEEKSILLLGRYTFDIDKIKDEEIKIIPSNKIIYKKYPKTPIEYLTIHSAKGLGRDNIIILNAINDITGFPSKIKTDPILKNLIETDTGIEYAEERRLFYVALTRTKNEVIILTPKNKQSKFVKEIKQNKNVKKGNKTKKNK